MKQTARQYVAGALLRSALAAAAADAEKALSVTTMDGDFTFLTGDTLITGYDQALATFRDTCSMLQK